MSEDFRNQLYNVDTSGRKVGFFPKRPKGKWYNWRKVVAVFLLMIMFGTPWIKMGGEPFVLLNFLERKFIILGQVFWPQDSYLVVFLLVILIVSIFLFTVAFGRIWCGWACPQTIFLEMVYRRIEYWIEGDAAAQRRLDKSDWNGKKVFKRSLKHTIFMIIAFLVSNTVLSYVIGMDTVLNYMKDGPGEHWLFFLFVILNTGVFYFVFAWFRERACIMVCPYGRLQGVMLDADSLVVSYDHVRGENRGKLKKGKPTLPDQGDCIDCKQCVAVCPTGIDIRNGTQLECVNCTACIDACDEIMEKVDKPKGLVRFASLKQIESGMKKWKMAPKAIAYTVVLGLLMIVFSGLLLIRGDIETNILRSPGTTYVKTNDGQFSNVFTYKILNKTAEDMEVTLVLTGQPDGKLLMAGQNEIVLPTGQMASGAFTIELPRKALDGLSTDIEIDVFEGEVKRETIKTTFVGPM